MIKYAHVGYPKAGSTWLQNEFFADHDEIFHLGRHKGDLVIDDDIRNLLWSELVEESSLTYDKKKISSLLEKYEATAAAKQCKAIGISQEVITSLILGRVDYAERARRVKDFIGPDGKVIIVLRNQLTWIESVYSGLVREGGLFLSFEEFLFYLYYDQDRSIYPALLYKKALDVYRDLFGKENLFVIPFEVLKENPLAFVNEICSFLGVHHLDGINTGKKNARITQKTFDKIIKENRKNRNNLGDCCLRRPWGFTAVSRYKTKFTVEPPAYIEEGLKRHARVFRMKASKGGALVAPRIPDHYLDLFNKDFSAENRAVSEEYGLNLGRFAYPM